MNIKMSVLQVQININSNSKVMKKLLLGVLTLVLTIPAFSQVVKTEVLSGVTVIAANYKYLNDVNSQEVASIPVQMLERKVAAFDPTSSDFYLDEFDRYNISFYIPEGKILAAYDKNGKLLRTIERFKDINIPTSVKKAISERFPEWAITKDVYRVNYSDKYETKKTYKLVLENGEKTVRVKTDEDGNFL